MIRIFRSQFLLLGLCAAFVPCSARAFSGTLDPKVACKALRGLKIEASSIALPTNGADIRSAKLIHDSRGEYCKVLGGIMPVDPSGQQIRFEVNLPVRWNHKALQFGGGSFDGWLGATNGLKRLPVSAATEPGPLARGFATFGGDSGHHKHYFLLPDELNAVNASFARNAEERRNFAHDGLKKTHDTALKIIEQAYGKRPDRMFFLGGSTGGREAFFVVQRWPEDYDGVMGAYAGWDQVELDLQFIRVSEAMYSRGGFLSTSKTRLLSRAVMNKCDALDGVTDGIIANVNACHFDPSTLLCPAGRSSNKCLTPEELHTFDTFATEQKTAQPLWHGIQTMPGYNVFAGADLTGSMGLLHHAEHPPKIILNSFYYVVGDQVLRFFLTGDEHFDSLTFDTTTGGRYAADLLPQSIASDASDSDLSAFEKHGGKLLIVHGTADSTIPTASSIMYFNMLQQTMGIETTDKFVRLYLLPGYGHGHGVFDAGFDALGTLDNWLETGIAPSQIVVVDNNRKMKGRTRPLCRYPSWPKYKGSGDINQADSFVCVTPEK